MILKYANVPNAATTHSATTCHIHLCMHFSYPILRSFLSELSMSRSMLAAAARADKSRCFCCESDFKIVSPASSVSLAVVCARSNVSERVSALETEFTSASLRSSSLSTAKEFLPPPPPPPPLDSTSKFPRDDFDFSNFCARVCERERERDASVVWTTDQKGRRKDEDERANEQILRLLLGFSNHHHPRLMTTLSHISKRLSSSRDDEISSAVSKTHKEDFHRETLKEKEEHNTNTNRYIYMCVCFKKKRASYRCGLLFSSHFYVVVLSSFTSSSIFSNTQYVHQ